VGRYSNKAQFLWQFLRHPKSIGSVTPSSTSLARKIVHIADLANARNIVEFGPGTGIFTDYILPELQPGSRFVAIERNEKMAQIFRRRHPNVPLAESCVSEIERVCAEQEMDKVDRIISGIPWTAMNEESQQLILDAVLKVLRPGGSLVTFSYLGAKYRPAGKTFHKKIRQCFRDVSFSAPVWLNLPPARVYICRN
jgi:phosphatidylethanolamine/phosphatidyl-N-methylethanolamine N-methyltransferase